MSDELEQAEGVEEQSGTAAPQAGVPQTPAPATAQEPKPKAAKAPDNQGRVNLDELPEFRKFKSETDKRMAALQQQYEQQLQAQRQQAEALRQQMEQAQLAQAPDDYSRLELQGKLAEQRWQERERQYQMAMQQQQQALAARQIEEDKRAWLADRMREFRDELKDAIEDDVEIPPELVDELAGLDHPSKVELRLTKFVKEKQKELARKTKEEGRKRAGTDDIDIGAGAPRSPSGEERDEWERATRSNDLVGAMDVLFYRAAKGRKP